jgi:diguanylate cyclase (GGDEF)-like protein/putative nucleotidyltransferase with HDIG domain
MSSRGCYNGADLAVAIQNARDEKRLVEEDSTDSLTGLKTRRFFMEALEEEWRRSTRTGRRFSLATVDLDGLQQVNHRVGQSGADKILKAAAALLGAGAKQPNVVARLDGSEFVILLPETNMRQAETLAEELRAAVEADEFLSAHEVTASVGIATFPDNGRTQEEILKAAASGRDFAKQNPGNCVKAAWPSIKPSDAERDRQLLEAYLETAPNGISPTSHDSPSPNQQRSEEMRPLWDTITALAFAVEAGDPYRQGHSQVVSRLAAQIATQMELPREEVEEIRLAGRVHDIGKARVPESVYNKTDLLSGEEYELMRSHASWGAKILESMNVKGIEQIVRHHHERYDGKGYPEGLAGEKIPRGARIVAVAECFHSMISDLPYKSACTFEDALDELRLCSGTQFDPDVVKAFLDWAKIYRDSRKQK